MRMRLRAQQITAWCRILPAGAEPSGLTLAMCATTSPACSCGGNTSSPTNSLPVTSTQFSLNTDCTACTTGPVRRTERSRTCWRSCASPSHSSTMQWPPTQATRPSRIASLRWSRSANTPMLRSVRGWYIASRQPASFIRRCAASPILRQPWASSTRRTCSPARACAANASAMRRPSAPSFQRKVSKCTLCRAAAMSASSASKKAPFSSTCTALPAIGMPSEMPDSEGISASSGRSVSSSRCGSLCRLIDQIARPSSATTPSSSAMMPLEIPSAPRTRVLVDDGAQDDDEAEHEQHVDQAGGLVHHREPGGEPLVEREQHEGEGEGEEQPVGGLVPEAEEEPGGDNEAEGHGAGEEFDHRLVGLEDEAVEEEHQADERRGQPPRPQVDAVGEHGQVEEQQQVVDREEHEAQGAPQQQAHAAARVAAEEERGAGEGGEPRQREQDEVEGDHR